MARLKPCRGCKNPVSASAKACPQCGVKDPSTTVGEQFGGLVVLAIIAAVVWFACFNDTGDEPVAGPATTTTTTMVGPSTTPTQGETTPTTTAMSNTDGFAPPTTPTLATVATTAPAVTTTAIPANPGDIVSCADFATWREAQDWFDTYSPHYGDVAFMDGNDNGVACEKLLPEGVTVAEAEAMVTTVVPTTRPTATTPKTTTTRRATTTTRPTPARSPFTDAERAYLNDALLFIGQSGGGFYRNGLDTTGDGHIDTAWDDPSARSHIETARQAIRNARDSCKQIEDMMEGTGWTAEEVLLLGLDSGVLDDAAYLSLALAVAHLC